MIQKIFPNLILCVILFTSCVPNERPAPQNQGSEQHLDKPVKLSVYAGDAQGADKLAQVLVSHYWGGPDSFLHLTNTWGRAPDIYRNGQDTLHFSKAGYDTLVLVIPDTVSFYQIKAYLKPATTGTPGANFVISGKVYDENGNVLSGVKILNLNSIRDSIVSDALGNYNLSCTTSAGSYLHLGYIRFYPALSNTETKSDTAKIKIGHGSSPTGKLDVFFDDDGKIIRSVNSD